MTHPLLRSLAQKNGSSLPGVGLASRPSLSGFVCSCVIPAVISQQDVSAGRVANYLAIDPTTCFGRAYVATFGNSDWRKAHQVAQIISVTTKKKSLICLAIHPSDSLGKCSGAAQRVDRRSEAKEAGCSGHQGDVNHRRCHH